MIGEKRIKTILQCRAPYPAEDDTAQKKQALIDRLSYCMGTQFNGIKVVKV